MGREIVTPLQQCKACLTFSSSFFTTIPWILLFPPLFFFFFLFNPRQNPTQGLVLQACLCSPDGRHFPGICTCLFISVKFRVPQRTVASCCILASLHGDQEDCYPLDHLAVTLFLFPCLQFVHKNHVKTIF